MADPSSQNKSIGMNYPSGKPALMRSAPPQTPQPAHPPVHTGPLGGSHPAPQQTAQTIVIPAADMAILINELRAIRSSIPRAVAKGVFFGVLTLALLVWVINFAATKAM